MRHQTDQSGETSATSEDITISFPASFPKQYSVVLVVVVVLNEFRGVKL